jgi:lipopolysaccharide transport system permease protein
MQQGWVHYLDLVDVLTSKALKARYKNTYLGYVWSLLNPLVYTVVFHLAFKVVLRIEVPDYALFLIAGLFPWQWFNNSLSGATQVYIANSVLVKKIRFPRNLIVMSHVLQDGFHFVLSLPVIVVALLYFHRTPHLTWIWGVPLLLAVQFTLTYGLALALASCNVFFRDLERIVALALFLLFYATPIFYPESMVPEAYRWILNWNPFAPLVISWRDLIMNGELAAQSVLTSVLVAIITVAFGHLVYEKLQWKFAEAL